MPEGIEDRNAEKWEPLFVVADVADVAAPESVWGGKARQAALAFLHEDKEIDPSLGVELLKDIRGIYLGQVRGENRKQSNGYKRSNK